MMQTQSWTQIRPLSDARPTKRWGHSSCMVLNELVIFGGYNGNSFAQKLEKGYLNDIWAFDTLTMKWTEYTAVGDVPEMRSHATLNLLSNGRDLVLFGGGSTNHRRLNSIHLLNWQTKEWQLLKVSQDHDIPEQRTYHTANVIGDYLVVFGGQNLIDFGDLWILDLKKHSWKEAKFGKDNKKPSARRFHASCVRNNQLFIVGGCSGKYQTHKDIHAIKFHDFLKTENTESLVWNGISVSDSDDLNRWGHSLTYNSLDGKFYVFGGKSMIKSVDLDDLIEIDIERGKVNKLSVSNNMKPKARRRHSANFVGSSLVIFGGFNGEYFNDLKIISIGFEKVSEKNSDETLNFIIEHLRAKHDDLLTELEIESIQNSCSIEDEVDYQVFTELFRENIPSETEEKKFNSKKNEKTKSLGSYFNEVKIILKPQSSVPEIQFIGEESFKNYIEQNMQIYQIDEINPEIEKLIEEETEESFFEIVKEEKISLNLNELLRISLKPEIKQKNKYFEGVKQSGRIQLNNIDEKYFAVLHVFLAYVQRGILIVPKNFSFEEWIALLELADYTCSESLYFIIERFFSEKVSLPYIQKFVSLSESFHLPQLSKKCSKLIINYHYDKFVSQNTEISESQIIDKFNEFEADFFMEFFQSRKSAEKFALKMMKYFAANYFSLLVRFANQVKDRQEKKQNQAKNQAQNNKENMVVQD